MLDNQIVQCMLRSHTWVVYMCCRRPRSVVSHLTFVHLQLWLPLPEVRKKICLSPKVFSIPEFRRLSILTWKHGCHLPTVCNFRKNSIVILVCSSHFISAALWPCGELFSFCCHCLQWTPVVHCLCLYLLQRTIQQLKLHLHSSSSLILFTVIFSSFKSCLNN